MAIHGSCIYCRMLKNISTSVSYIKIYYVIYHIISSNIFTYFVRKGQEINLRMAYLQFSTLNWDIQYFKTENKMTHFSFKSISNDQRITLTEEADKQRLHACSFCHGT